MSDFDVARALKDQDYFARLTAEQQAQVRAANPAGESELSDDQLDSVSGGLEGRRIAAVAETTTTTDGTCTCPKACVCSCTPKDSVAIGRN